MENQTDNTITLAQLPIGKEAKVLSIQENGSVSRRLMEMGVVPGVLIRVVKTAPFGDPIEIRIRNYSLALRRSEAQSIRVK